ncbi:MAG: TonB-dependent receptor [Bacteroidetes bacterium]|nr:MAG: TonB-dependent receptor [Bacteroidota bacterium]
MKYIITIIILFLGLSSFSQAKDITISGYVREKASDELLIGVNIYIKGTQIGTISNSYGFYSLTILAQEAKIVFSYVGYEPIIMAQTFNKDSVINIYLESNTDLSEVDVYGNRDEKIADKAVMSVVSVPVKQVRDIPALLGEKDVFKVLQLMPGIRGGSEASSGLYVRGGGPDQNLVILDDAVVYNAMHLFGFFSVFNGDAIKSIELYKGGFPARFGGRLSSVIDMSLKDGNRKEFGGEASIGLLSSRLLLEGPIIKNKSSFIISGRRSYVDVLAAPIIASMEGGGSTAGYYFYDLNAKANYEISDKDKLYLSGYFGRDKFYSHDTWEDQTSDSKLFWENATGTFRWNHQFSNKLFSNTSFIFSNYQFVIEMEEEDGDDFSHLRYKSGIRDLGIKTDLTWVPNNKHYIRYGGAITNHLFTPSAIVYEQKGFDTELNAKELNSIETSAYIEDEWKAFNRFKVNMGLRFSNFNYNAKSYFDLEPRILASYMLTDLLSIKASYAQMSQYVHLLTSTGIGLPTDLWVPSTDRVGPQKSKQFALGMAKDFEDPNFSLSVEAYYKTMTDIISYKEGASFMMFDDPTSSEEFNYEDAVTIGKGYSTGIEVLLQRKFGKLTGWIGYTLSLTKYQFDELNNGKEFFPRHDRRHDFSIVGIYKLNEKITLSATWIYGTGDAVSLAKSTYTAYGHNPSGVGSNYPGQGLSYFNSYQTNHYGDKNSFRMAAYHRLDVGAQFKKKLKKGRERVIEVSLYNAYSRQNPFYYYTGYDHNTKQTVLKQVSLFPILPGVSYYLKF